MNDQGFSDSITVQSLQVISAITVVNIEDEAELFALNDCIAVKQEYPSVDIKYLSNTKRVCYFR